MSDNLRTLAWGWGLRRFPFSATPPPDPKGKRKCYPEKCVFLRIRLIRRNLAPQPDFGQFQPIIGQYSIFYIFLHLYYYYCYYSLVHLLNFRC